MKIKEIMDRALFALSVPKCVCCKTRLDYGDLALCPKCSAKFKEFKSRNCSRCARLLHECDCSNEFLEGHFVKRVIKCFRYRDTENSLPGNSLIYSLKRDNRNDVLEVCTAELCAAIRNSVENPEKCIFTNIPRRKAAIVEHGIDHSALLARAVAKKLGARYIPLFRSNAKRAQKSLERTERMKNANFSLIRNIDLSGKQVIIVDDIITTGASISMAASLARSLGAKNIAAACLAIAYRDS